MSHLNSAHIRDGVLIFHHALGGVLAAKDCGESESVILAREPVAETHSILLERNVM
jgi:hypothetical protein